MKKCSIFISFLYTIACYSGPLKTSQTFMFTRPYYHAIDMNQSLWSSIAYDKQNNYGGALQIIPSYQRSVSSDKVASYFLLGCKHNVSVVGDMANTSSHRDVRAEWVGLPSDFSGLLSVNPEQEQGGVLVEYNQDLKTWCSHHFFKNLWIGFQIPFIFVKNNLHLCQKDVRNPGTTAGQPTDILTAFSQPDWRFAKMNNCNHQEAGVAEFKFMVGSTVLHKNDFLILGWSSLSIAAHPKQHPNFIFNPIVGPNGHFDFGSGIVFELPLHEECAWHKFHLLIRLENHYFFDNHQYRTFDLWDKPWSRYMTLRNEVDHSIVPAMNILTQKAKISAFDCVNFSTCFRYSASCFEGEIGYTLWGHTKEKLTILTPYCEGLRNPIEAYGIAGTGDGSSSRSTISNLAPNDEVFTHLYQSDINTASGAMPAGFTNRMYATAGYNNDTVIAGLGGAFEWPQTNIALKQWQVWGKIGISF